MVASEIHVDGHRKGERKMKTVLIQSIVDQNKLKSDGVSGSCILLKAAHLRW